MSNLWEFLLQTLTVSLTAGLLLLCKALFRDKLPPRWQYGIWLVLALRILLPVRLDQVVLFPLPLLVETTKTALELPLSSAFLTPWEPLSLHHVLPLYTTAPHSITDWLFCLYGAGVLFCLIWYLVGYIRFRLTLRHGRPISPTMAEAIDRVCEMYRLRACAAVVLPGLHTACICGGLRPVLVLPEDEWDDEHTHMVLLHELLHLRYRDGLASIFWCVLRCLHWCNPFLWWVFRQIEGDMEALCDSRVMERLEGEDRRTYGRILLSMATKRYSNTPGTSSIANGTKTIARRIETIARFTRYPKGTETAALCIAVLLAFPVLAGTTAVYDAEDFTPDTPYQLQRSLAMTRLHRCSTMAGAIDNGQRECYTKTALRWLRYRLCPHKRTMLYCSAPIQRDAPIPIWQEMRCTPCPPTRPRYCWRTHTSYSTCWRSKTVSTPPPLLFPSKFPPTPATMRSDCRTRGHCAFRCRWRTTETAGS